MKRRTLRRRYGHARGNRVLVREIRPYVNLYRDSKTGIAWVEDGTSGAGYSAHPHIDASGSILGMKNPRTPGHWGKHDRTVRSHGWIYNIDRDGSGSSELNEIARAACNCGGIHGGGR